MPVVVLSASTKISTSCPTAPGNAKLDVPPAGTVPTPETIGAPTGVGGTGSYGSFHWNTRVLPLVNAMVCAISTSLPPAKSWKPPAYNAGSTVLKSRLVPAHEDGIARHDSRLGVVRLSRGTIAGGREIRHALRRHFVHCLRDDAVLEERFGQIDDVVDDDIRLEARHRVRCTGKPASARMLFAKFTSPPFAVAKPSRAFGAMSCTICSIARPSSEDAGQS